MIRYLWMLIVTTSLLVRLQLICSSFRSWNTNDTESEKHIQVRDNYSFLKYKILANIRENKNQAVQ